MWLENCATSCVDEMKLENRSEKPHRRFDQFWIRNGGVHFVSKHMANSKTYHNRPHLHIRKLDKFCWNRITFIFIAFCPILEIRLHFLYLVDRRAPIEIAKFILIHAWIETNITIDQNWKAHTRTHTNTHTLSAPFKLDFILKCANYCVGHSKSLKNLSDSLS